MVEIWYLDFSLGRCCFLLTAGLVFRSDSFDRQIIDPDSLSHRNADRYCSIRPVIQCRLFAGPAHQGSRFVLLQLSARRADVLPNVRLGFVGIFGYNSRGVRISQILVSKSLSFGGASCLFLQVSDSQKKGQGRVYPVRRL